MSSNVQICSEGGDNQPGLEEIEVNETRENEEFARDDCAGDEQEIVESLVDDEDFISKLSVGSVYNSWEAIEALYKTYAMGQGFGVARCQSALCADKKTKRAMTWRCERYGDPDKKENGVPQGVSVGEISGGLKKGKLKKRKSKKCNCMAMLYSAKNGDGQWVIKKVELSHSGHSPTPTEASSVKEYRMRMFTDSMRKRVINDVEEGVSIAKIHGCIAREREGLDNCPFTEKDIRHIVDGRRRRKMQGGDANALWNYLKRMKKNNVNFYSSCRADEHGRLKDVFWADGRSRVAYKYFGDVICFDSTYVTNKYHLPFANFVGVNHHGQSLLLGCALVSHEDSETFVWVFKEWLESMGGNPPGGILTDQAAAMRQPIADVMPTTRHRWCLWHIMRKFPNKFSTHSRYDDFKEAMMQVVYDSFSVEEFCRRWGEVIVEFDVENDEWLIGLYREREMWAPIYLKEMFWAGMRTTQRVESINSFFDKFVTRQTRLCDFGERYSAAVERRVRQEKDADALDKKHVRSRVTGYALEWFYREKYTDAKYRALQRECDRLTYVVYIQKHKRRGSVWEYDLEDRVWRTCKGGVQEFLTDAIRMYKVQFNSETHDVHCCCFKFEHDGILCRHCIRVLDMNRVSEPNEKYVLDRWRKDVVRDHSAIKVSYSDPSNSGDVCRLDELNLAFQVVGHEACWSPETVGIVKRGLTEILKEVRARNVVDGNCVGNVEGENPNDPSLNGDDSCYDGTLLDPPMPKKKRGRPKRTMTQSPPKKKKKRKKNSTQQTSISKRKKKEGDASKGASVRLQTKRHQKRRKVSALVEDARTEVVLETNSPSPSDLLCTSPELIDVPLTGPPSM